MRVRKKKEILTGITGEGIDYSFYKMSAVEIMKGFGIGFLAAAFVIFIFFKSLIAALAVGVVTGVFSVGKYRDFLIKKRREGLLIQFKDFLEGIAASYSAGRNTRDAFFDCQRDLLELYGEDSDIVKEVRIINSGLENNYTIEVLLLDLAKRSGLSDIKDFADIFVVCNLKGGDIRRVVVLTRTGINEKIEMEQKIAALTNPGKNELYTLLAMPIVMNLMLSGTNFSGNGKSEILVRIICLFIFILAYLVGKKIIDINV